MRSSWTRECAAFGWSEARDSAWRDAVGRGRLGLGDRPGSAVSMWGWAGAVTLSEGRWAVSSGLEVELVGHGLVERELRRRLGLGGVELGRLVEEQVGLRRCAGGRNRRR